MLKLLGILFVIQLIAYQKLLEKGPSFTHFYYGNCYMNIINT